MGPLQGIKVLDLTCMVSGPVAAMMLGDLGADVIKVEPTLGEQLRYLGERHNDITPTFYSCNRNKKSLAIDSKSDAGKEVLWKLIDETDVSLQNFRPGAIERMGFAEEEVRNSNNIVVQHYRPFVDIYNIAKKDGVMALLRKPKPKPAQNYQAAQE